MQRVRRSATWRRPLAGLVPLLACALVGTATAQEPAKPPVGEPAKDATPARPEVKNLVLVTLDTLRSDRIGCYGYFRDTMPHFDAVAARGLRFTNCRTPIAQTTPSHVSIFTGVGPYEHGVLNNQSITSKNGLKTSETLRTVTEMLHAAGLKTGGFVGAVPVKRCSGLDVGFDVWSEPGPKRRLGGLVIADALQFIDGCAGAPFFVWVHLFDAHEPLGPPFTPDSYVDLFTSDPKITDWMGARGFPMEATVKRNGRVFVVTECNNEYDGALRFLDDQLEVLLARLRQPDVDGKTALVLIADHGTALGQHLHFGHGICWDEQLRVPLVMQVPGLAPRVVDAPMSSIDLWPTVAGLVPSLFDPAWLVQCRGTDVLAQDYDPRPSFAIAAGNQELAAVTAGRWKLLRAKGERPKLYDHDADPNEIADVAVDHPEIVARLAAMLDAEIARQQKSHALHKKGSPNNEPIDPAIAEQLRELGYTDDSPTGSPDDEKPGDEKPADDHDDHDHDD